MELCDSSRSPYLRGLHISSIKNQQKESLEARECGEVLLESWKRSSTSVCESTEILGSPLSYACMEHNQRNKAKILRTEHIYKLLPKPQTNPPGAHEKGRSSSIANPLKTENTFIQRKWKKNWQLEPNWTIAWENKQIDKNLKKKKGKQIIWRI